MAGAADLDDSPINMLAAREHGVQEVLKVLDTVRGPKDLVLDPQLSGPLGQLVGKSLLTEHGVEKLFHLEPGRLDAPSRHLIYLLRPKIKFTEYIAQHIHHHVKAGLKKEYYVFFVPRSNMICEKVLEDKGIYDFVTIGEAYLDLFPFDNHVMSMELESSFRECFLDYDRTSLFYVARSIMKLQSLFGIIPNIKGKGHCAKSVGDMLTRMRREAGGEELHKITPEIDTLILLDRTTDLWTPMCTPLTYEGLIDEVFGIHNGAVELDPRFVGREEETSDLVKTPFNSNDKLFKEVRDMNFSVLGPWLNQKAREVEAFYNTRTEATTVARLRDFIKGLGNYQQVHKALRMHTNVAEQILGVTKGPGFRRLLSAEQGLLAGAADADEFIMECIAKRDSLLKVLRLVALQTQVTGGFKAKTFDRISSAIIETYGYEYMFTLNNLTKLGLFNVTSGKSAFAWLKKELNLLVLDIDEQNPQDMAYVYSGYAPLSCRIVEYGMKRDWEEFGETVLKPLPGPAFHTRQDLPAVLRKKESGPANARKVVLVFFIGGVTFTEISALRYLNQKDEKYDYVVATTKMVNGDTLLSSCFEQIDPYRKL